LIANNPNHAFKKSPDTDAIVDTREAWYPKYKQVADTSLEASKGLVTCKEIQIPRRDGITQSALLYQPSDPAGSSRPLLVQIHGGGFCYGCPEMEGPTCIGAVQAYGCVAISLSYRLAPENKFPSATDDCWDAFQWVRSCFSLNTPEQILKSLADSPKLR
jgi:acetyl esterase/lipase